MKTCDVIIPTYNNEKVLALSLEALFSQDIPADWVCRCIISDDGSHDRTLELVQSYAPEVSWKPTIVVTSKHSGVAGARNRGVDMADGDVIFFLGADIVLRPGALQKHLEYHSEFPDVMDAAVGMVKWDPRIHPSPLMEWMIHGGGQNAFDALLGTHEADPRHAFYCSNISLKRQALSTTRFSEAYKEYGWEDFDLGRRLAQDGIRLTVLHNAIGLHHHYYSVEALYKRQEAVGRGLVEYQQQFPNDAIAPGFSYVRRLKVLLYIYTGLRSLAKASMHVLATRYAIPGLFSRVTAAEFWRGVFQRL